MVHLPPSNFRNRPLEATQQPPLRLAASQGLSPPQLFGRLAEVSAYTLHLCSPSGRPLLAGVPGAPAGWVAPASGTGVRPHDPGLISVPVPLRGRIAGYLVAVEQPGREALGLLAVRHIATIAALELANLQRSREAVRREGGGDREDRKHQPHSKTNPFRRFRNSPGVLPFQE